MRLVWLDGRVLEASSATIAVEDRGLLFGDGLFETMRAWRRSVFRLEAHLDRLARGAARLSIPFPAGLDAAIAELLETGDLEEAALRLTLTRGPGADGLEPPAFATPTLLISLRSPPAFPRVWYERGLSLRLCSHRTGARSATAGLKTIGYLPSILALAEARASGSDDALLLNEREEVTEASASNLFWVSRNGELRTPSAECGILPGITRAVVLELARSLNVEIVQGRWGLADLKAARETFATSSLRGVVPVTMLDGRAIGEGVVGDLTRRIIEGYEAVFRRETG